VARASQQQFYTVLLADDSPVTSPDGLAGSLRSLRRPTDEVQYEILRVTSVDDAITALALNGEIQAAIIRHDLSLRSRDRLPIMTRLLGVESIPVATDRTCNWVECVSRCVSCGRGSTCTC
jgi:arginine decarboxylase